MGKRILSITGILLAGLTLISACSNPVRHAQNTGAFSASINMASAPAEVYSLDGVLFRSGHDTIHFDFFIENNTANTLVRDIPPGSWKAQINAYNNSSALIYTGEANVNVVSGAVSNVLLHLSPAYGKVNFIVTWGDTADTSNDKSYAYIFEVDAKQVWPNSGVMIDPGSEVKIEVISGEWRMNPAQNFHRGEGNGRIARNIYPLPGVNEGSLIASISDSIQYVGNMTTLSNHDSTAVPLKLMINDEYNYLWDNSGSLLVRISKK
ncbi:hypothetical protein CHISP_1014 [Chitinispirillum alkaliphilum]|nr:hypothetical protein CHISP_1014 [Chitinispirillum alkaliphilum]